jgi:hypothetical protein
MDSGKEDRVVEVEYVRDVSQTQGTLDDGWPDRRCFAMDEHGIETMGSEHISCAVNCTSGDTKTLREDPALLVEDAIAGIVEIRGDVNVDAVGAKQWNVLFDSEAIARSERGIRNEC